MTRTLKIMGIVFLCVGLFILLLADIFALTLPTMIPTFVLYCIGLCFAPAGAVMLIYIRTKARRNARLLEEGLRINARLVDVQTDRSCKINGISPYVILCGANDPETGAWRQFRSEGIWFCPHPFLEGVTSVPVYLDRAKPRHYYVALSGILPETAQNRR